jgi:hypothetical protein
MPRDIIVVGFELGARISREDLTKHVIVKPPGNLKDPAKIQAWFDEKRESIISGVHESKLLTTVEQVYAVNLRTQSVLSHVVKDGEYPELPAAVAFINWLASNDIVYPEFPPAGDRAPAFYGFGVRQFIRAAGIDCNLSGVPAPLPLWYADTLAFDPYEMLVETEIRGYLPLASVCNLLQLTYHEPGHGDCLADAKLATELITKAGLAPLAAETRPKKSTAGEKTSKRAVK